MEIPNSGYKLALCMLASGSKGNAIYVTGGGAAILIDAGLSGIEIERRLNSKGISPTDLDAIVVSHEHGDHIQGVGALSRRFDLPVYINPKTYAAGATQLGNIRDLRPFECGVPFEIKNLRLHPFSISHDAMDPAGFAIHRNGAKIGIATDLGITTSMVKEHLKQCHLLVLEANHDPAMLINGPYPWPLKQRIKGRCGHLSNEDSKRLLEEVFHKKLRHVILAHMSETNNSAERALDVVGRAIAESDIQICVSPQNISGDMVYLR
ncbi:MBL fold metallo-hydrolase [Thermodesulfobacteriota bacterium]